MRKNLFQRGFLLCGGLSASIFGCQSSVAVNLEGMGMGASAMKGHSPVDRSMEKRPNVLLIIVDDHGYADFSYKGLEKGVQTPNLDRLVGESALFENGYSTSPICSPSRCGILTGTYQQRMGNFWFGGPGLKEGTPTIAEHFQELGYDTSYVGKLHYGRDNRRSRPQNHGFDYSLTAPHGGRLHYLYHSRAAMARFGDAKGELRMNVLPMVENGIDVDRDGFTTEIFAQSALDQMKKSVSGENPFFVQLAFNAVHNFTWQLPGEYLREFNLPKMPDWDPAVEPYTQWYDRHIRPNLENGRAYYLAQLYYMDREIGKLVDYLDEEGLREETIILYTSDNGGSMCNWGINTPLRGSKYTLYEGGIRVPFIVSWKGKIAPQVVSGELASGLDIMPTLLDASGREYLGCDGISLMPYLLDGEKSSRDTLVWDAGYSYAVRKGDWKLKVITNESMARSMDYEHTDPGTGFQLYNLKEDVGETTDLSEKHPDKVAELKAIYRQWRRKIR